MGERTNDIVSRLSTTAPVLDDDDDDDGCLLVRRQLEVRAFFTFMDEQLSTVL